MKQESFTWYDKLVEDNFAQIKTFLDKFEKSRDIAIEELIKKFNNSICNNPLFCFNEIPSSNKHLIDFLMNNYHCKWVKNARFDDDYLFSWDEIPGNDNVKLIEFLTQKYGVDWVRTAQIKKIEEVKTIMVSTEKNFLLLRINDEKPEIVLTIDDCRTSKLALKLENSKLCIYDNYLTIKASKDNNSLSLKINETKNRATLVIDGELTDEFIVREEEGMLNIYKNNTIKIDYHHPISIALTYGYSAVLSSVLKEILSIAKRENKAQELHIKLIKSEGFKTQTRGGKILLRGEQQLRDELVSIDKSLEDRCNIFPIEMIKERKLESQISKIFIGIESISTSGNVVHPRQVVPILLSSSEKINIYVIK